jgi:FeS assembly SUF system regulator
MLRLSKLTDYAVVIMAYLSQHPGLAINAKNIAEHTGISLPTTSKLLKRLSHEGLLLANRGIKGGYQLAFPATDISLGTVIQTLEGPIALTECSHTTLKCSVEKRCTIRDNWRRISAFIQATLMQISLADLIQPLNISQFETMLKTDNPLHLVPENNP